MTHHIRDYLILMLVMDHRETDITLLTALV